MYCFFYYLFFFIIEILQIINGTCNFINIKLKLLNFRTNKQQIRKPRNKEEPTDKDQQRKDKKDFYKKAARPEKKQNKIIHNRLIIRNLVFDINDKHLKKLFAPFGNVLEVNIPRNPDTNASKGFAFIEFENRNNCLKAIKELNGTQYKGRSIILDESVSKQRFMENKINQEQKQKAKIQVENIQQQEGQNMKEQNDDLDNQEIDQEEQDDQSQMKQQAQQQVKPYRKTNEPQDLNETIFIRNLPINVTEEQLHKFFRKYDKIKFAKVVMNKQTNTSRGTAFVKFHNSQKSQQLIQYSKDYQMNLLGKNPNFKLNPAINLQLQGTVLKVFPVQTRDGVSNKIKGRDQKEKERAAVAEQKKKPMKKVKSIQKLIEYDPHNKRNLHLALIGINRVTQQMKEQDQLRFRQHEKQKLQKLKNPNNSVSDRRIILKFLKKDLTEKDIQQVCNKYLTGNNHKFKDLTYCKLMLESLESKKSAGFAFVEFKKPQISLGFLQWLTASPQNLMKQKFICQFAIQNSKKLIGKFKSGLKK